MTTAQLRPLLWQRMVRKTTSRSKSVLPVMEDTGHTPTSPVVVSTMALNLHLKVPLRYPLVAANRPDLGSRQNLFSFEVSQSRRNDLCTRARVQQFEGAANSGQCQSSVKQPCMHRCPTRLWALYRGPCHSQRQVLSHVARQHSNAKRSGQSTSTEGATFTNTANFRGR